LAFFSFSFLLSSSSFFFVLSLSLFLSSFFPYYFLSPLTNEKHSNCKHILFRYLNSHLVFFFCLFVCMRNAQSFLLFCFFFLVKSARVCVHLFPIYYLCLIISVPCLLLVVVVCSPSAAASIFDSSITTTGNNSISNNR
jgi:hypothetical protein